MFKFWKKKARSTEPVPAVEDSTSVEAQEVIKETPLSFPSDAGSYAKHPFANPNSSDTNILFEGMVVREFIRYDNEFIVKLIPTELLEEENPSEEVMLTFGWMPELEEGETYAEVQL